MENPLKPLDIKTTESASVEQLRDNILENFKQIKNWVRYKYASHLGKALLVSAGKSFTENPEQVLKYADSHTIFCVKHCLPYFKKIGVQPHFVVALDPRPIAGTSTLGHKREDLYSNLMPGATYLIASMTHPSVTKYLLENDMNVLGWNSMCAASELPEVMDVAGAEWVVGGSSSAMRAHSLATMFGYRDITFLGYDSTVSKEEARVKDPEPAPEELELVKSLKDKGYKVTRKMNTMELNIEGENFFATPELAAQIQDAINIFENNNYGVVLHNLSGGAFGALFDAYVRKAEEAGFYMNPFYYKGPYKFDIIVKT